jgi:biopolymer transport protein ExbD/biopolymer transport protein TolR
VRRARKAARLDDIWPDINVTPLVDVVLVLLIICMVVAPRLDQDIPVDLPGIFNPDPDIRGAIDPLKVTVAKAGEYYIEGQQYTLGGAIEYLGAQHDAEPSRRVVLRADATLTYGDVRDIFARCQQIGFPGMSLLVGERHKRTVPNADTAPGTQEG